MPAINKWKAGIRAIILKPTLVVKTVRQLMSNNDPDSTEIDRLRETIAIEGWLQYASWEHCDMSNYKISVKSFCFYN